MERNQTLRLNATTIRTPPLPVGFALDKIRLPYYESIAVGSVEGASPNQFTSLLAGYRYLQYTSPVNEAIELYGWQANFQNVLVRIQFAETRGDIWVPFYSTQMTAAFGYFTQVEPVSVLSRPYLIPPRSKIQIAIQNTGPSNIDVAVITLVGVRLREVAK